MNEKGRGNLYGNGREAIKWALSHWQYNYKDELKGVTVYLIAQLTGFSAQWLNTIMREMYYAGEVAYREEQYRKNSVRRVWVWVGDASEDKTKGWAKWQ